MKQKGAGREFHGLKGTPVQYVNELVGWLNEQVEVTSAEKVEGYSQEWQEEAKTIVDKYIVRIRLGDSGPGN